MRTFRDSWSGLVVGLIFLIVPIAVFSIPALLHSLSGEPLILSDFRSSGPTHPAGKSELATMILGPLVVSAFGVLSILSWIKQSVQTYESGVRRIGVNGSLRFSASWFELKSVSKHTTPKGRVSFIVRSESSAMEFPASTIHLDELLSIIRLKAPQVDFSPWD